MELVEGETLSDRLRRTRLPLAEALELGRRIAEGLEAAHEKDILHRDLKPAMGEPTEVPRHRHSPVKVQRASPGSAGLVSARNDPCRGGLLTSGPASYYLRAVAPGESARFLFDFRAPETAGSYFVEWDLVSEGECWFAEAGSQAARVPLQVTEPAT